MILVTGAGGQLGQALKQALAGQQAVFMTSAELDVSHLEACQRVVRDHGVTTIINAAAYTKVDLGEADHDKAFAVNGTGAENLARAAAQVDAAMVHVSTDYVFDGMQNMPYVETDVPNPQTVYGCSKLAGEKAVMKFAPEAVILRTSWLYGETGQNFVKTMLRLGREKDKVGVVMDQVGSPTYAGHLARDIVKILPQIQPGMKEICHYSDEGVASWYDFARFIMQEAVLPCQVEPIRSAAYPTPALRPAYSVLDKSKVKSLFKLDINHWHDGVVSCVKRILR